MPLLIISLDTLEVLEVVWLCFFFPSAETVSTEEQLTYAVNKYSWGHVVRYSCIFACVLVHMWNWEKSRLIHSWYMYFFVSIDHQQILPINISTCVKYDDEDDDVFICPIALYCWDSWRIQTRYLTHQTWIVRPPKRSIAWAQTEIYSVSLWGPL